MKKTIVFALVFALLLTFAACGAQPKEPEAGTPAEKNDDPITIGLDILQDDSFGKQMVSEAEALCEEAGWKLEVSINGMDSVKTISNVDTFITKGVDYIIVHEVDLGVQETCKEKADAAGIPIVFVGVIEDGYILINSNDYEAGKVTGENVAAAGKEKWGDEPVDLVITYGISSLGQLNTDRLNGMIDGIRETYDVPDEKYIVLDGERDPLQVTKLVSGVLTANPDAERVMYVGIHSMWDMGAFNAFESAGRLDQLLMATWHCYIDTLPDMMNEYDDTIVGSMDLPGGEYVAAAFKLIHKMVDGETVEPGVYYTDFLWLDKDNISQYY